MTPLFGFSFHFRILLAGFFLAGPLPNLGAASNSQRESAVDKIFAPWNKPGSPGAAVVITQKGRTVYQHGYGLANLEHRIPNTPETVFDVASVAKQFTGMAAALLMEQGKLSLTNEIHQLLPNLPDFGRSITLAHLFHHTSGLRDWPETLELSGLDLAGPISLELILEMVRRQRELDFPVGDQHLYSNTGYNLIAAAFPKVTGKSFRDWSREQLFEPLGMSHSLVLDDPSEVVRGLARPYAPDGHGGFRQAVSQLSAPGSSSLFTTASDLGKWLVHLESGKIGGIEAMKFFKQPGKLNNGSKLTYALGIGVGEYRGHPTLTHGGSWAGYRSFVLSIPEKKLGVAILANSANLNASRLAYQVADVYLGPRDSVLLAKAESAVTNRPPDPALWDQFTGVYRLGPGWLLTITRDRDQLWTQASREKKFPMTAQTANRFWVEGYGAAIEFNLNGQSPSTNLVYRNITAPRLHPPSYGADQLRDYAGNYWSEEVRYNYRLELHEGRLATRSREGKWIGLIPVAGDQFDSDGGGAIVFTRNPEGRVKEMKVSGGRVRNLRFEKVSGQAGQ